jgi:hypothetical protein
MSGKSKISVLYRGVFVQEYEVNLWGIEGSIDVDPKHFKPRLNREGFVGDNFQQEVQQFLIQAHPKILVDLARQLSEALTAGQLDKWNQHRWATLWLSVPRDGHYAEAANAWDQIFRRLPAFEQAVGNKWEPISLEQLLVFAGDVYVAPHPEEKPSDIVNAAIRLLRNSDRFVIRGLRRDRGWLKDAGNYFATTADLITSVFANELPNLIVISSQAESILSQVGAVCTLYGGTSPVDLVRLGSDAAPVVRLGSRLILNIDSPTAKEIVEEVVRENSGQWSLITITARHSYEHLTQVAAVIREFPNTNTKLGLVKRRFIRGLLS